MTGRKKIGQDDKADDFICGLPKNLIDNILERLPLRDAVRTSILSKKWRYLWSARSTLVFDKQFFEMNFRNKSNPAYAYLTLIHNILLLHTEPVNKFTLHIPKLNFDWNVHLDKCLLFLTRNGINELELSNVSVSPFQLPSCLFSCPTLKALNVNNCIFTPLKSFTKFVNLNILLLQYTAFAPDTLRDTVLTLPCLTSLHFRACRGIENFKIVAPKLIRLSATDSQSHDFRPFSLDKFPYLTTLMLGLGNEINDQWRDNSFNFDYFLKKSPNLVLLFLNGPFLKLSGVTSFDKRLSFRFRYLKYLELHWLRFDDPDSVSCALCLLRSSPNLEILTVTGLPSRDIMVGSESVSSFMEAPNLIDEMSKLKVMRFTSTSCSKLELLFVKGILACSPSLRTMRFQCNRKEWDRFKILNELLRFRGASSQAEVICSDGTLAATLKACTCRILYPKGGFLYN